MAWAANQKPPTATAKLCLLIMSSMADHEGKCWPSHNYLAEQCMVTRRTIISTLQTLESEGFISVQRRFKDNVKTSSMYTVNVKSLHNGSETISQPPSEIISHRNSHSSKQSIKHYDQTGFDRWWAVYPKKKAKKEALRIWDKIKPDGSILWADTIERTESDRDWKRGFAPNPTTYLNQERWNDEISRQPSNGTRKQVVSPATANREAGKEYFRKLAEGNGNIVG